MEQWRNGDGTVTECRWNGDGTEIERWRNGDGKVTERRWNGDGTETWRIVWIGLYLIKLYIHFSALSCLTTDSVNRDHSDGTEMERWRNGNVTHSVNRPLFDQTLYPFLRTFMPHDGQCEQRPFWRNGDGTVTERKRDAVWIGPYLIKLYINCFTLSCLTTDSVNRDCSDGRRWNGDGTEMERWRNGNVTHSGNRPLFDQTLYPFLCIYMPQSHPSWPVHPIT